MRVAVRRFSHPVVFVAVVSLGLRDWVLARGGKIG